MPRGKAGTGTINKHGFELYPHIAPAGVLRALTYRRKSMKGDEDGDVSLDVQLADDLKLIQDRGWVHVGDAWDMGAEGVTPHRLGYQKALAWGYEHKYDVLVVWRSDRPFRNMAAGGPLEEMLMDMKTIGIASVTDNFDPRYLAINAFTNRHEWEGITVRTTNARLRRARSSELMAGTLPYWIGRDRQNHGVLIDDRAAVMVELARRYLAGEPTRSLARWMRSVAPPDDYHRNASWSSDRICDNLKHRALVGELPYSAAQYTKTRNRITTAVSRHRTWKPEEAIVIIEVPSLLHRTAAERSQCSGCEMDQRPTFAEVQAAISRRHSGGNGGAGRPAIHAHPLRNKVYCGVCEGQMAMSSHTTYIARSGEKRTYKEPHLYLRCPRGNGQGVQGELAYETGTHKCRTPSLLVVQDVYASTLALLKRQDLPAEIEAAAAAWAEAAATAADSPTAMLAEVEQLRLRAEALTKDELDLWEDRNLLGRAAWAQKQAQLLAGQQAVQTRIDDLERTIAESEQQARRYDVVGAAELADKLRGVELDQLSGDEWADLVLVLVRRVTADEQNRYSVELTLPESPGLAITLSLHKQTAIIKLGLTA